MTIAQPQIVSTTNSTVTISPTVVAWGYGDRVEVLITLKDTNNNPLSGITVRGIVVWNSSKSIRLYSDYPTNPPVTGSNGQARFFIYIDGIHSSYIPQYNAIVEADVLDGSTTVTLRASEPLYITGKASYVSVTPDRQYYSYGDTITVTVRMYSSEGYEITSPPAWARILDDRGVVVRYLRQVITRLRDGNTFQIPVNTTNFPWLGRYEIEVADNSAYSSATIPMQLDLNSLLMPMLSLVFIMSMMSLVNTYFS